MITGGELLVFYMKRFLLCLKLLSGTTIAPTTTTPTTTTTMTTTTAVTTTN